VKITTGVLQHVTQKALENQRAAVSTRIELRRAE